jgi:single-strand DNA-binding protein
MIKIQIIGHLGKDAEIKEYNGKKVMNYSVAHTEKYTKDGVQQTKTIWVDCSQWSEKTAVAQYLKKGTQVYVEGIPEVRTWESNGKHGATLQVRVIAVNLLGSKQESQSNHTQTPVTQEEPTRYEPVDDLPF